MKRRDPWRARAERLRAAPLEPLAARLGYRRDPSNRARWKRAGSVLSISGEKFFDHRSGRGGGGAIDLVMRARRCGFRAAVEFLAAAGPLPPAPSDAPASRPANGLRLPPRAERHWPQVHAFLVQGRGLDPRLLRLCRRAGILYADPRRNAVFLCRNRARQVTGAEIVGTAPRPDGRAFKGMAPGSRKARGGFWLPHGSVRTPSATLLVESAIDALSLLHLLASETPPHSLLASTAGVASSLPRWLRDWPPQQLVCAYDADPAGDQAAAALRRQHPLLIRLRPDAAKDWNDLLRPSV